MLTTTQRSNRLFVSLALVAGVMAPLRCIAAKDSAPPASAAPRLAVVISIDQFRADYLERFRPYFVKDGFRRLLDGGANFEECHYRYASTKTAVGHASMLTGVFPDVHGIIANDWADRSTLLMAASVEDHESPLVGLAPTTVKIPGGLLDAKAGRSPRRLLVSTVGDQLKIRFGAASKVIGVSNKDRSAILMAGKLADAAYWDESGRIVSSQYYGDKLPAWADAFNAARLSERYFGKTWDRLLPVDAYNRVQGPDEAEGEFLGAGLGRVFPRKIDGGAAQIGTAYWEAFDNSPFASEFLTAFTKLVVTEEKLGKDDVPDLLCLSFSQPDTIGHNYGTDSHEIMDSILRLDRMLAEFFAHLDATVGAGKWVTVITADHGAPSMPERVRAIRPEIMAGRIKLGELDAVVRTSLAAVFGAPPPDSLWAARDNSGYHFPAASLATVGADAEAAAQIAKKALLASPWVSHAWTRGELLAASADVRDDSILALVRRSFHAERGQDVVFVLKPYLLDRSIGTNHGTPWEYDTHVPQLWYGAGVAPGRHFERVGVEDLAPTLAALLGVPPPPEVVGHRLF